MRVKAVPGLISVDAEGKTVPSHIYSFQEPAEKSDQLIKFEPRPMDVNTSNHSRQLIDAKESTTPKGDKEEAKLVNKTPKRLATKAVRSTAPKVTISMESGGGCKRSESRKQSMNKGSSESVAAEKSSNKASKIYLSSYHVGLLGSGGSSNHRKHILGTLGSDGPSHDKKHVPSKNSSKKRSSSSERKQPRSSLREDAITAIEAAMKVTLKKQQLLITQLQQLKRHSSGEKDHDDNNRKSSDRPKVRSRSLSPSAVAKQSRRSSISSFEHVPTKRKKKKNSSEESEDRDDNKARRRLSSSGHSLSPIRPSKGSKPKQKEFKGRSRSLSPSPVVKQLRMSSISSFEHVPTKRKKKKNTSEESEDRDDNKARRRLSSSGHSLSPIRPSKGSKPKQIEGSANDNIFHETPKCRKSSDRPKARSRSLSPSSVAKQSRRLSSSSSEHVSAKRNGKKLSSKSKCVSPSPPHQRRGTALNSTPTESQARKNSSHHRRNNRYSTFKHSRREPDNSNSSSEPRRNRLTEPSRKQCRSLSPSCTPKLRKSYPKRKPTILTENLKRKSSLEKPKDSSSKATSAMSIAASQAATVKIKNLKTDSSSKATSAMSIAESQASTVKIKNLKTEETVSAETVKIKTAGRRKSRDW